MSAPPSSARALVVQAGSMAIALGMGWVALKYFLVPLMNEVLNAPDPKEQESKLAARALLLLHAQGTGRPVPPTNAYEERLIVDLVFPAQIDTTFEDIGGLDELKRSLYETVILPPAVAAALRLPAAGRRGEGESAAVGAEGRAVLWAARVREDHDGAGHRQALQGRLPQHPRVHAAEQVVRREPEADQGHLHAGRQAVSHHRLHRRDRPLPPQAPVGNDHEATSRP